MAAVSWLRCCFLASLLFLGFAARRSGTGVIPGSDGLLQQPIDSTVSVPMKTSAARYVLLCLCASVATGAVLRDCGLTRGDFEQVSDNGFDSADHRRDANDYPWSIRYFAPTGAASGHVYVGTGNNIGGLTAFATSQEDFTFAPYMAPEVRRHRPDLGARVWETVLDFREVEPNEPRVTGGVRSLHVHRVPGGIDALYAGTFGDAPALLRSATGDPGSFERIFTLDKPGSIRAMASHNGMLYFATTIRDIIDDDLSLPQGVIYLYDGDSVTPVVEDGFGDATNLEAVSLCPFNGWLYAGTRNFLKGFQIWKFAGPNAAEPVLVVDDGGPDPANEAAGTMAVFQNQLYVGTLVFSGLFNGPVNTKGCDLIRITAEDEWTTVVGEDSISAYRSGFDNPRNAYLWQLEEHDGWLYAGTWDDSFIVFAPLVALFDRNGPRKPILNSVAIAGQVGPDLYKSPDGRQWYPVFRDGLKNFNNQGIRTLESTPDGLYLGMTNLRQGLQIWRAN